MTTAGTRPLRVLLADDTEHLRALVAQRLADDGRFEVVAQAGDGESAVALADTHRPDVVVLDLSMPGIDGLEALRRLRATLSETQVVVLSGFRAGELAPDALALGAAAYVEKGVELDRIAQALADVCGLDARPTVLSRTAAPTTSVRVPTGEGPPPPPATEPGTRWSRGPLVGFVALVVATVLVLTAAQSADRQRLHTAFTDATQGIAHAVAADVSSTAARTTRAAEELLGSPATTSQLAALAVAVGARDAVLVEDGGELLRTRPDLPSITGVTGLHAASPLGELAYGIGTTLADGRDVTLWFSPGDGSAASVLAAAAPATTELAWLVDADGGVLATTGTPGPGPLVPPTVAGALAGSDTIGWSTEVAPVPGTGWSVVAAVRGSTLHGGAGGLLGALPWLLVAMVAGAGVVALSLVGRSRRDAAALAATNRELRATNDDLEQFAWVASHDLQEPLRKVASYCQLLERRYGDQLGDDGRQYVAYAVDGAARMQQLIADLLRFSRVGRDGTASPAPLPLLPALQRATMGLASRIEETGATVELPEHAPTALADPAQLQVVLHNLLANALKFRRPGEAPRVEVAAALEGDQVHLTVTDDGIGIAPEHHEQVFGVFRRLHPRDAYEGTGIGLAVCRRIVDRAGGRIWVSSTPDYGATFHVLLPAPEEQ